MSPSDDFLSGNEASLLTASQIRSWVLHEDKDFLVFNKPGGVVCHPSKNGPWSSLVGGCREVFALPRVHLAHRLDRETSGLVVLARHRASARRIQMAFTAGKVRKGYLAIVEGHFAEPKRVTGSLAKALDSEVYIKQAVRESRSAQKALTHFHPLWQGERYSLVFCFPQTGRKHQIRAHAAWSGHPICGDKIYGPDDQWYLRFIETGWTPEMEAALRLPRQALHASILAFEDSEGETVRFTAPLPLDMGELLKSEGCGCDAATLLREGERIFEDYCSF
ncbi:MAG: RluA family pseudouridine synthase [Opitutales bacterium]|nr:RluA family pseudouridine synthase [Opitutales bacterium]MCH8540078.1 RluA family pseudouridine synthase [Opitutales bacterium]